MRDVDALCAKAVVHLADIDHVILHLLEEASSLVINDLGVDLEILSSGALDEARDSTLNSSIAQAVSVLHQVGLTSERGCLALRCVCHHTAETLNVFNLGGSNSLYATLGFSSSSDTPISSNCCFTVSVGRLR